MSRISLTYFECNKIKYAPLKYNVFKIKINLIMGDCEENLFLN